MNRTNQSVQKTIVGTQKKKKPMTQNTHFRTGSCAEKTPIQISVPQQAVQNAQQPIFKRITFRTEKGVVPKYDPEHTKLIPEPNQKMWSEGIERHSKALKSHRAKGYVKNTCFKHSQELRFYGAEQKPCPRIIR